jgi:PAS domain S-box-containing protein
LNDSSSGAVAADDLRQHLLEISRERDSAYGALQEREAELARVQRIGRVGGVEVDLRDGFRNRRSLEYLLIHGLPPEATNESHQDWVNRIHPDDREATEKQFLAAIAGKDEDYTAEYRIIRPNDGELRWIRVVARIERDQNGYAIRLLGAHIDVTDRMLAQETLHESERRFRLIANSAPVPIWVTKLDRTRSFANEAYVGFVGLPYEEAIKYDWRKALHPDDLTRILKEQIEGESSLKPFVLEARYKRADGEWRWLRSESQPRWDPTGKHIGFIGVAHDITAAKNAEIGLRRLNETLEERILERTAQLEAGEARMRAVLESSHQYQVLLSPEGDVLYANKTALAGIRAEAVDVIGKRYWDTPWFAGTKGMSEAIHGGFARVMQGENVQMDDLMLELPIGSRFFDFTMRPVFDQYGKVTGAVPEAIDITERRHSEEALRQSQKMEVIGQLTGGVAHDFNNLLTIIRSATDFLRRRDLPEDRRRRYVDAISDTVERASKLISQLLAFARRHPLKPEIFNVSAQVEGFAQLIRPLVGSRIRVETNIVDPECFAIADVAQFETALINLAVNGRDAMLGEGRLTITVKKVDLIPALRGDPVRLGAFVGIAVEDTGAGIAPENLAAIFEPFFTTKEVGKGTGLGLSQAFGFVKQSDGDIAVASQLGKGTKFTIYLPQSATAAPAAQTGAVKSEVQVPGKGHSVLVVDDNEEVGRFSAELLEDLGYIVKRVSNAKEALALLAEDEFAVDLVFSDVIMPGMNGLELGMVLRERYPGLPVVLTSGYSDILAENTHSGFELIQKPYSVELLSRILRKSLAARK